MHLAAADETDSLPSPSLGDKRATAPHARYLNGGANIAFADGHVKWFRNEEIKAHEVGGYIRFNGHELFD